LDSNLAFAPRAAALASRGCPASSMLIACTVERLTLSRSAILRTPSARPCPSHEKRHHHPKAHQEHRQKAQPSHGSPPGLRSNGLRTAAIRDSPPSAEPSPTKNLPEPLPRITAASCRSACGVALVERAPMRWTVPVPTPTVAAVLFDARAGAQLRRTSRVPSPTKLLPSRPLRRGLTSTPESSRYFFAIPIRRCPTCP